jgi:transcriptional regulator with XRE-family HTH domain
MSLADRLKLARESIGKSQKEMAESLGTSFRAWQDYEAGKNVPGGKVFEALVKLGLNANWLLTGEGVMRNWPVIITKDIPDGFGRAREISYRVYEDFSTRLHKELVRPGFEYRTIEMLAQVTNLPLERLEGFFAGKIIPTVDDLEALASALQVSEIWLAEGDIKTNLRREASIVRQAAIENTASGQLITDDELTGLIYEAVEDVSSEWGKDENILSSKERAQIAQQLFRIFSNGERRQFVTRDSMAEQAVILFMLHSNKEKVSQLVEKLGLKPSDQIFQSILQLRTIADPDEL